MKINVFEKLGQDIGKLFETVFTELTEMLSVLPKLLEDKEFLKKHPELKEFFSIE